MNPRQLCRTSLPLLSQGKQRDCYQNQQVREETEQCLICCRPCSENSVKRRPPPIDFWKSPLPQTEVNHVLSGSQNENLHENKKLEVSRVDQQRQNQELITKRIQACVFSVTVFVKMKTIVIKRLVNQKVNTSE